MIVYRGAKLAPTCLVGVVGAVMPALILWKLGLAALTKWYFYPSLLFWLFSVLCVVTGISRSWDRLAWKGYQWWSGGLAFMPLLLFFIPWVGIIFGNIVFDSGGNPIVAVVVHVLIWSFTADILKPEPPPESSLDCHAES